MKKTILIIMFILLIPLAFALYGGETWTYTFDKCDILRVNITGTEEIIEGEYTILNNCTKNDTDYYICNCNDNYDFKVTFKINAVNNYTFDFNYAYSKVIEEQQSSGGGGSSSRNRIKVCTPDWNCTEWGNCQSNNRATRTCNDLNECNATRPTEERYCYYYVASTEPTQEEAEVIEQVEVTEPTEQLEQQEEKGIAFGWWVLIGVFIVMVIIIIVFIVKSMENQ